MTERGKGRMLLTPESLFPKFPHRIHHLLHVEQRDLQPVAMLSFYPMAAVVPASSPVRSLKELVALSHKQSLSAGSGV